MTPASAGRWARRSNWTTAEGAVRTNRRKRSSVVYKYVIIAISSSPAPAPK
jgi:hypothetical protein